MKYSCSTQGSFVIVVFSKKNTHQLMFWEDGFFQSSKSESAVTNFHVLIYQGFFSFNYISKGESLAHSMTDMTTETESVEYLSMTRFQSTLLNWLKTCRMNIDKFKPC